MMRAFYIICLVLCVVLILLSIFFVSEIEYYRSSYFNRLFSGLADGGFDSDGYESYRIKAGEITFMAAGIATLFLLFFLTTFILSLVKIKTKTMLVMSILGIVFTAIELVPVAAMLAEPRSNKYNELGLTVMGYCILALGFSIVGVVHAFRTRT